MKFLINLLTIVTIAVTKEQCRLRDIQSIMGGTDYEVEQMRASIVSEGGRTALIVYGGIKASGEVSKGFAFFYDEAICSVEVLYQYNVVTSWAEAAVQHSQLILVSDRFEYRPGSFGEIWTRIDIGLNDKAEWVVKELINGQILADLRILDDTVIHKGIVLTDDSNSTIWVASSNGFRFLSGGLNSDGWSVHEPIQYLSTGAGAQMAGVVALQYGGEQCAIFVSQTPNHLIFDILLPGDSVVQPQKTFRVANIAVRDNINLYALYKGYAVTGMVSVAFNNKTTNTIQVLKLSPEDMTNASATAVSLYEINASHQVLHVQESGDSQIMTLVSMTASNELVVLAINASGVLTCMQSAPLDYLVYQNQLPRVIGYPNEWEFFIVQRASQLTLSGETFSFPNPIGFIVGTLQNRITPLLSQVTAPTMTTSDQAYDEHVFEFDNQGQCGFETFIFLSDFKQEKNGWKNHFEACSDLQFSNVTSQCLWFDVFDDFKIMKHVETSRSDNSIPKSRNSCDDAAASFTLDKYKQMSAGSQSLRNTCFPVYVESQTGSTSVDILEPPIDGNSTPLVSIDRTNNQIVWGRQEMDRDLVGQSWNITITERTDDYSATKSQQTTGFNVIAKYSAYRVTNRVIALSRTKSVTVDFLAEAEVQNYNSKVTCWSRTCNPYLKQNATAFFTDLSSNIQLKDEVFVYYVELNPVNDLAVFKAGTFTFNVTASRASPQVQVNITQDFATWIQENRGNLPFHVSAPRRGKKPAEIQDVQTSTANDITEESQDQNIEKPDLIKIVDPKISSEIAGWSDVDIQLGIQEAKERRDRVKEPNPVTVSFSNTGQLKVTFEKDVNFPSYINKETENLLNPVVESKEAGQDNEDSDQSNNRRNLQPFYTTSFAGNPADIIINGTPLQDSHVWKSSPDPPIFVIPPWTQYVGPDDGPDCTFWNPDCYAKYCNPQEPMCLAIANGARCRLLNSDAGCWITFLGSGDCEGTTQECNAEVFDSMIALGIQQEIEGQECIGVTDASCEEQLYQEVCDSSDPTCPTYIPPEIPVFVCDTEDPSNACYQPPVKVEEKKKLTCKESQYLDEQLNACQYYDIYFGSFYDLFEINLVPADSQDASRRNLSGEQVSKKLIGFSPKEIKLKLEFENPMAITPDDRIYLKMGKFTDFDPGVRPAQIEIPAVTQIMENDFQMRTEQFAQGAQAAAVAAALGSVIVQVIMSASLQQVWSMVNGMQFILHTALINILLPGSAFIVLNKLIIIAVFDFPYVSMRTTKIYDLGPHQEIMDDVPTSLFANFEQLSYGSANISDNLGTMFVITLLTVIGLILAVFTLPVMAIPFKWTIKLNNWLVGSLCWNTVIRLILEGSMEYSYCLWISYKYGKFSSKHWGTMIDGIMNVLLAFSLPLLPIFIVLFYLPRLKKWDDDSFQSVYGAPLDGLRSKKTSLIYPVFFLIRRMLFATVTMTLFDVVVIQLFLHWLLTTLAFAYVATFDPFTDPLVGKLDMFNEAATVIIIDLCFLFTANEPSASRQYKWGYVLGAFVVFTLSFHIFFLFKDSFQKLKLYYKREKARNYRIFAQNSKRKLYRSFQKIFDKKEKKIRGISPQQKAQLQLSQKKRLMQSSFQEKPSRPAGLSLFYPSEKPGDTTREIMRPEQDVSSGTSYFGQNTSSKKKSEQIFKDLNKLASLNEIEEEND